MPSEDWWTNHPKQVRRRCPNPVKETKAKARQCRNWFPCKAHRGRPKYPVSACWRCDEPGCSTGELVWTTAEVCATLAKEHAGKTGHTTTVELHPQVF